MTARRVKVADLSQWARRKSSAYDRMGSTVAGGARDGIFELLKAGIKHAPKHTGALRRSLQVRDRQEGDTVQLALYSPDPAAGMQESGGTLLAQRRLMTVPVGEERAFWDASGTRREPRQIAGLFRIRAADGRSYLVTRRGRDLVVRFALRRKVRQDGQGWATAAVREAGPRLMPRVEANVVDALLATDRAY